MAKRVVLVDDLTDEIVDDADTVVFGYLGNHYEIDLSPANQKKLREALAPFVDKARPAPALRTRKARAGKPAAPKSDKTQNRAIREWAKAQGKQISDRGAIPAEIQREFEEAHKA
jgi:hypothetical protein